MAEKIAQRSLSSGLLKRVQAAGMRKTGTPTAYRDIQCIAEKNGFEVSGHQQISTQISFDNATDMTNFAVRGGWLLNASDYAWLPTSAFYHLARLYFHHLFTFPLKDHHIVEVVLLQRKVI